MKNTNFIYECEDSSNARLYEFLAANYDISNLANKIKAQHKAYLSLMTWKKSANNTNA